MAVGASVAAVDPLPGLTPVLCFVDGEWPLFSAPNSYAGVRLTGTKSIGRLVSVPRVLESGQISDLAQILAAGLPGKAG
jgi:hypothetical protein